MSANAVGERCSRCVRGAGRAGEKRVCAHQQLSQWAAAHRRRRAVQRYGELVQQKVGTATHSRLPVPASRIPLSRTGEGCQLSARTNAAWVVRSSGASGCTPELHAVSSRVCAHVARCILSVASRDVHHVARCILSVASRDLHHAARCVHACCTSQPCADGTECLKRRRAAVLSGARGDVRRPRHGSLKCARA